MSVTTLYRLIDEGGRLLYVGIAGNVGRRMNNHSKDKPWWTEGTLVLLEHFPSRDLAEKAERQAIWAERPIYNKAGVSPFGATKAKVERGTIDRLRSIFGIERHVPRVKASDIAATRPCALCDRPVKIVPGKPLDGVGRNDPRLCTQCRRKMPA